VARRRPQRGLDGGATMTASFSPAVRWQSKTGNPNFVDGGAIGDGGQQRANRDEGHGGGELREREDDEQ